MLLAAAVSSIAGSGATAAEQVAAVLKTHEVRFVYRSVVNVLACDELRTQIATILRALGARDDVQVRVNDCQIVVIPDDLEPPWDRSNREYPRDIFRDRNYMEIGRASCRERV